MAGTVTASDAFEARVAPMRKTGRSLIVGSRVYPGREDRRYLYAVAEGWDVIDGDGVDRVVDLEQDLPPDAGQFDHIECISVLEHSRAPWLLAGNIQRLLSPGGTLHLTVPFVWRFHAYPSDYWRFTAEGVRLLFPLIVWLELIYANESLKDTVQAREVGEWPYFPRTEVYGLGVLS